MQPAKIFKSVIFAAFVSVFCLHVVLALADAPALDVAGPVDCAVIATAMKSDNAARIMIGSYGANCDWNKLGAPINTTGNKSGWIRDFSRPRYDPNGLRAKFEYSDRDYGVDGHFIDGQAYRCTLQKAQMSDKGWRFVNCIVLQA